MRVRYLSPGRVIEPLCDALGQAVFICWRRNLGRDVVEEGHRVDPV